MSVGYFGYYIWVMIPSLALAGIATWLTKSTFTKYSRKMASSQMTGAQAARHMLDSQGLRDVRIERAQGFLSDHYDPRHRVLRLSPPVYDVPSLSAIGVACHEAGHAMLRDLGDGGVGNRAAFAGPFHFFGRIMGVREKKNVKNPDFSKNPVCGVSLLMKE